MVGILIPCNVPQISTMAQPYIFNRTPRHNYYSNLTFDRLSLPKVTLKLRHATNDVSCSSANAITKEYGIGIVKFLQGKSFLVTGATGLLGKVLIEKILRTSPEIGKIYLLIKAKSEEHATHRVRSEIMECELFEKVKQIHGSNYYDFMTSKLVPVIGNIAEGNLGIDSNFSNKITQQVDVIINSAANTTFDERYDVALNINTKGPLRVLNFAKKCSKLQLLLHVSTAYVNGVRKGIVMERPFNMGDNIAAEMLPSQTPETLPKLDIDYEIQLALDLAKSLDENETHQRMKELGLMRARKYGWTDVYTFSKAMGEMMLSANREQVAVVIVRPSIIESTYSDPFPGWIEGNRMIDPILLSYGKGLLPGYLADPNGVLDIVPVDVVVNTMLSAMAKHATQTPTPSQEHLSIYHVSSSVENPITTRDVFSYSLEHFRSYPTCMNMKVHHGLREMEYFDSMDEFSTFVYKEIKERLGLKDSDAVSNPIKFCKLEKNCKRILNSLMQMALVHLPYAFYKGRFDNSNSKRLMEEMCIEEQKDFCVDMKSIDWQHYFSNIHAPALTKHFKT